MFGLLEGNQSWGGRTVMSPFLFFFIVQPGWISRAEVGQVRGAGYVIRVPDGFLKRFYEVQRHSLCIFHHLHNLPFVPTHFDNFQKTELLVRLTQLITLKVAFWKEYVA